MKKQQLSCGRQTLVAMVPFSCVVSSHWMWMRPATCFLTKRQSDVHKTASYNTAMPLLEEILFLIGFEEATMRCANIWRGCRARNPKISKNNGAVSPAAACKQQTSANNHRSLEVNSHSNWGRTDSPALTLTSAHAREPALYHAHIHTNTVLKSFSMKC